MDNLTHGLVGLGLSAIRKTNNFDFREPVNQKAVFWATALGSQFPDLDIVFRLVSDVAYLQNHRGITHSLVGLMAIPLIITGFMKFFFPVVKARIIYFWAWVATGIHICLDLLTSYGTMALWPLNTARYAWDVLMIIDPLIIVVFYIAMFLTRKTSLNKRKVYATVFAVTIIYVSSRAFIQHQLFQDVARAFSPKTQIVRTSVIPNLLGYNKWHFVVETRDKYYIGTTSFWPRNITVREELRKPRNRVIEAAVQTPVAQIFNDFARYPYPRFQKEADRYLVTWADLRYSFNHRSPFSAYVSLDKNLRVIKSGLGSRP